MILGGNTKSGKGPYVEVEYEYEDEDQRATESTSSTLRR